MSMTPAEVRHLRLRRRPLGYRRRDVDGALDELAASFEEVWRSRADLEERLHVLEAELERHRGQEVALRRTLVTAERSSEAMRADARREADRIVREAEQRAREIVGEAQHERERIRHEVLRLEGWEAEILARLDASLDATRRLLETHPRHRAAGVPEAEPAGRSA